MRGKTWGGVGEGEISREGRRTSERVWGYAPTSRFPSLLPPERWATHTEPSHTQHLTNAAAQPTLNFPLAWPVCRYFDPTTQKVHEYDTGAELRTPTDEELKWIETKAPISSSR